MCSPPVFVLLLFRGYLLDRQNRGVLDVTSRRRNLRQLAPGVRRRLFRAVLDEEPTFDARPSRGASVWASDLGSVVGVLVGPKADTSLLVLSSWFTDRCKCQPDTGSGTGGVTPLCSEQEETSAGHDAHQQRPNRTAHPAHTIRTGRGQKRGQASSWFSLFDAFFSLSSWLILV